MVASDEAGDEACVSGQRICTASTGSEMEMASASAITDHYARAGLGEVILEALKTAGKDIDKLTPDDLAPLDEHHPRGRSSTVDLARLAAIKAEDRVLDLGSGIGGPSRYLAKTFGCRVLGIDLTPEFCRVAAMLTERTGLTEKIQYQQGDALEMAIADQSFDVVWSQEVAMNIADRDRLYAEIRRVLKPGGRYVFADVVASDGRSPHFPVPWAREPSASFLLTAEGTRQKIEAAGFYLRALEDQTGDCIAQQKARANHAGSPAVLGIHIVLGREGPRMLENTARNFEEGRTGLVQGVAVRSAEPHGSSWPRA